MRINLPAFIVALAAATPAFSQQQSNTVTAEIFARLPQSVGNVAFTPDNQVIFSHQPFYSPDVRVAKLTSATTFEPFPNAEWNTPLKGSDQYLDNVLGLRSDENGVVWMIDMGFRTHITPKLVGWNTHANRLERIYYMPEPVTRSGSQPQDIDMNSGRARRVLEGDKSTVPENVPITVDGNDLTVPGKDGKPTIIKVGCDGITMDAKAEWLYYAPLSGRSLYRIRVADLNDESLSSTQLSAKVERYSDKPNNGGLSIDFAGNIYLTAVETKSIGVITPDRKYRTLTSDAEMVWPDGISYSPDGHMYVSASQVSAAAMFHGGKAENKTPYLIYRFKPLAAGIISR